MPRAVVPAPRPRVGVLPYLYGAVLYGPKGAGSPPVVPEIPISVWPSSGRDTDRGRSFDHQAETPIDYFDDLRVANRKLEVNDRVYTIVDAVRQPHGIPHVALKLRDVTGAGS